jgi:hypothetical protein
MHLHGIDPGTSNPIFTCTAGKNADNSTPQPLIMAERERARAPYGCGCAKGGRNDRNPRIHPYVLGAAVSNLSN